ncbi:hypothetical protein [Flavobacterium psychrophilum]|uniref:hypothetical protein n=1 Tax=Flavobacterium psychrophilum TaxID=96345 RepID=UPI000B7C0FF4|nr:hypothetical protein [Flavobacterium psychrophilum]EKT4497625.1 hypothetical protein [Flavobacterium psychrophilum]ELY1979741.1 hypothetical protein [Flavobacterium psychrophilum]MCB6087566.1 hypothetical protein [Flavobacterium psychrophilum]MCB6231561.1 hypothetical protein [Flavobacterium psychrophilum]MEB3380160.1 hypothetical protein [Flavobacterium psychrophilum]
MSVINQYITFLKEYKKLLKKGVKDVLSKSLSSNFVWIDNIQELVKSDICNSNLANIFLANFKKQSIIFSLAKPKKTIVKIPNNFLEIIEFDEAKNKFLSINNDDVGKLKSELQRKNNCFTESHKISKLN